MTPAGALFSLASLVPAALIALGAWAGGGWAVAALLCMSLVAFALDELVAVAHGTGRKGQEFPAAPALTVLLGLVHFALLAAVIPALGGAAGLSVPAWIATYLAAGLWLGQVSNANAHELIHARSRARFLLGRWVYISMLFGHHVSAHLRVHHVHAASDADPNSAKLGRSYYRFLLDAWAGSFRKGLAAETARHGRTWRHPYLVYAAGALIALWAAWLLGGLAGLLAFAGLAAWAQAQLLLSDYVQHYGLRRARRPDGRLEPVGPAHSWNAPHWFSGYLMVNAPRHSDHHMHPDRPFPALSIDSADRMPTLPYSLPAMGMIALVPPLWRRLMDPRAAAWAAPPALRAAAE